ncbi:DNA-binding barrel domain superfamily [Sesbania bispinosa]|nr:DNA-binding barrel domain superfamily [Sesbania bispinosa]
MGLKKCGKHILFCNKWEEFVESYSISYGCHLVFKYEGKSKFNVLIFDATSVEIYYPCKDMHPKFPRIRATVDHQDSSHQTRMSNSASKRAKDAASASNKEPKKPYFTSTLKRQRLYVPVEFAQKYLKPNVPIKLQTSSREQWDVSCVKHCAKAMIMAKGIPKFARENKLSEGDSFVLELIKREPLVLKVTPSRAVEYGNSRRC